MFRFLRPNLVHGLRRPFPLRARLTRPPNLVRNTLAIISVSLGALALHASNDAKRPDSDPDQPPLTSLLRAYLVFSLCSFPSLVDASPRVLSFLSTIPVLREVSEAFLRITFFDQVCISSSFSLSSILNMTIQFVGAETVDGCIPLLHNLRRSHQGVLLNYSAERPHVSSPPNLNGPTLDSSQRALESILHSIDIAGEFEESLPTSSSAPPTTGTWVAIKLSTLLPDPSALWVLSDWIVHQHIDTEFQLQIPFPGAPAAQDLQLFLHSNDHNIAQHIQSLRNLHLHLRKICTRARDRGIRLAIDAEETWFQPAIDLFAVLLMQEFNSLKGQGSSGTITSTSTTRTSQPLVYTTLQTYLVRTPSFLDFLIKDAKDNQYSLGVKLVRGAYIDAEVDAHSHARRDRSLPRGTEMSGSGSISPNEDPPTYPNKGSTDEAYDNSVRVLVGEVARDVVGDDEAWKVEGMSSSNSTPGIGVLFGTHNWKSSRLVLDEILRVGLGKEVVESNSISGSEATHIEIERSRRGKVDKKIILSEEVPQRVTIAQLYGEHFLDSLLEIIALTQNHIHVYKGMSDSLAAYLVDRTSPSSPAPIHSHPTPFVIRNIPYGPLRDVMPYLARRAVENRSVLGSSATNASVSRDGSNDGPITHNHEGDERGAGGRAVEERKRVGRLIWGRVVGLWRF